MTSGPARIEAILFDFGGTLRHTIKRDDHGKREKVREIQALIGSNAPVSAFERQLSARYKAYRDWAQATLVELGEEQLWTQWLLPDWPSAQIAALANELNLKWREATGIRIVVPETRAVIVELAQRGYRLGVVSNTVSSTELPRAMEQIGIAGYMQAVVLSAVFGRRKPDPAMLLAASEALGVAPACSAYVGNRVHRDVIAARRAGFGKTVIIRHERDHANGGESHAAQPHDPALTPDHTIGNLKELLAIFPAHGAR